MVVNTEELVNALPYDMVHDLDKGKASVLSKRETIYTFDDPTRCSDATINEQFFKGVYTK